MAGCRAPIVFQTRQSSYLSICRSVFTSELALSDIVDLGIVMWNKHAATTYIPHTISLMCFLPAQFCFASWIAISIQGFAADNTELLGLYIDGTSVSLSEELSCLSKSPISPQEGDACKVIVQFFIFIPITLHTGKISSHEITLEHISAH